MPVFTIPLGNKVMDTNAHLVWTCEAFGIPEVYYNWYKNGIEIGLATMSPEVIFANKFC